MDASQRETNTGAVVVQGIPIEESPTPTPAVEVGGTDHDEGTDPGAGESDGSEIDTEDADARKEDGYARRFSFHDSSSSLCGPIVAMLRGTGCTSFDVVSDVWSRRVAGGLFGSAWLVLLSAWMCAPPNHISAWMAACTVVAHVTLNSIPHSVVNSEVTRDKSVTMVVLFVTVVVELLQCVIALAGDGSGDGAPGALFGAFTIASTFIMRLLPLDDACAGTPEVLNQTCSRVVVVLAAVGGVVATCLYAVVASSYPDDSILVVFPPQGVAIGGWFGLVVLGRASRRSMAATWLEFWPAMSYVFLLGWPLVLVNCNYLTARGSLACWTATLFQIVSARLVSMVTPAMSGSNYGSMAGSMMW